MIVRNSVIPVAGAGADRAPPRMAGYPAPGARSVYAGRRGEGVVLRAGQRRRRAHASPSPTPAGAPVPATCDPRSAPAASVCSPTGCCCSRARRYTARLAAGACRRRRQPHRGRRPLDLHHRPGRRARDRQHRHPHQLRHPLASGRARLNHEAHAPIAKGKPWPPLHRIPLTLDHPACNCGRRPGDAPSYPPARPPGPAVARLAPVVDPRRRPRGPGRPAHGRRSRRRRRSVRVVPLASARRRRRRPTSSPSRSRSASASTSRGLGVDFEIVVANDVKPWGGTGLTVDPGVIYVGRRSPWACATKFDVSAAANFGLIPLVHKGIVDVGYANWFVEAAFPMTAMRGADYSLAAVAHTGFAF